MRRLTEFKALSFDCYGTLIDWESGLLTALEPLRRTAFLKMDEQAVLEAFAEFESEIEAAHPADPYPLILQGVHDRLANTLGMDSVDQTMGEWFGRSVGKWPAFPDSAKALRYLKQHYKLIVLSNVDRSSFEASRQKLGITFDAVYTAEDVGHYKPDIRNFEYMLDRARSDLNLDPHSILHVAQSLYHDHVPAKRVGLATAWIDRRAGREGGGATRVPDAIPDVDFRFESMAKFVTHHKETIHE